jgi:hypothetical protein
MEDQTAFELNQVIQRWREDLAKSPAFRRENLNELESHLRDSVAALQTRGFSAEEAFLVATRRLGQSRQLEAEFSKLNRSAIWLERAMWMLIGLQVWSFFEGLMSGIAGNLFALGSRMVSHYPTGNAWPVFVSTLIQLPALIAAVWLTWTVLRKTDKFGAWIASKLARRSSFALCCIAACVLALLSCVLLIGLIVGQWKFSGPATVAFISRSRQFIAPLRTIGFAILTLVVARKWQGLQNIRADQTSFDLNQMEPHLRDSVATLQPRGLSAEEAFVIATRRIGQGRQLEAGLDKTNRNSVWLARALWMLIGIQVWPFFDRLMSGIAGNLFAIGWKNVHQIPSAVGDAWPVFFSALIQLPALIAAVWLTWKSLRKSGKIGQWIATKLTQRSSFVICCIAASVLALLLYALVVVVPMWWYKFAGEPSWATVSYIDFSRTFIAALRIIGFTLLTLLLARKRFVPQKA